jgi:SAM-dependent methyltransferase
MQDSVQRERQAWDLSARAYATYAARNCLYVEVASAVLRLAEIAPGMTVIDLACGTGVVTETILGHSPLHDVRIIATDYSPAMIAAARERITAPNVTFHCGPAENFSCVTSVPVDRVLCSAAFWQLDRERVLREIARVLTPEGKCAISVPAGFGALESFDALYETNKLLWMVLDEMAIRGHDPKRAIGRPSDSSGLAGGTFGTLADGRLLTERVETISIVASASEYLDFLHIPVMARRFSSGTGVPPDELMDILAVVRNQLEWVDVSVPPQEWSIVLLARA